MLHCDVNSFRKFPVPVKIQFVQHTSSTVTSLSASAPIAGLLEPGSEEEELCAKSSHQVKWSQSLSRSEQSVGQSVAGLTSLGISFWSNLLKVFSQSGGDFVLIRLTTIKRDKNLIWGDQWWPRLLIYRMKFCPWSYALWIRPLWRLSAWSLCK